MLAAAAWCWWMVDGGDASIIIDRKSVVEQGFPKSFKLEIKIGF
jgi:hypothetical protein